jgi:phenylacetate-CoA ligase
MKPWNAERAMMYRNWRWAGFKSGDRIVTCIGDLSGEILGPSYAPYSRYRNEIEISPDHLDKRTLAYYVDLIREFKPAYFRCYPGVAIVFARFMEDHGIEPPPLKSIWTQSERFTDRDRQYIEGFWGAPINDYYGQQEKAVAAGTCEHGRMHIHSEFCFVELIETDHPPLCKIVTTGFYADAMPLLRYDTKDFTIPLDDPCPCGRELPAIESIVGRVDDWIVRADGSPHIDIESQLKNLGAVRECQMIQESLTYSKILVVPAPNHDYSKKEPFKALMEEDLGPGVTVDIEYVDEIPRTGSGKRRLTISKVANNWVV